MEINENINMGIEGYDLLKVSSAFDRTGIPNYTRKNALVALDTIAVDKLTNYIFKL